MKIFHLMSLLGFLLFLSACDLDQNEPRDSDLPNIIFIMADDLGYGDLGCYGGTYIQTPNIDQMAAEGLRFTQCYAGAPVSGPSRCVLMTGKHSGHATRRDNRTTDDNHKPFLQRKLIPLRPEDYTIAEMLKEAGYTTGAIGKWGLGNLGTTGIPNNQGFDYFYGYLDQVHAHNYFTDYLIRDKDTVVIHQNLDNQRMVYCQDLLINEALNFIRRHQSEPFFLYLPFTIPHGKFEIPNNTMYADQPWGERVKNYAAMVSRMDKDIGRIFALLANLKLDENTIVFFTSDHGPNESFIEPLRSNKPFRGYKRQLLEGGIRVPMIVRWPGRIREGVESDFVWAFWDVMPTLAHLAGTPMNRELDGISVLPTLLGGIQQPHDFLYWEFYNPFQQAVRLGNWKGMRLGTQEPIVLYDLDKDPKEQVNLAEKNLEIVERIKEIMAAEHDPNRYWPSRKLADLTTKRMLIGE